jgi:hypothetical protein
MSNHYVAANPADGRNWPIMHLPSRERGTEVQGQLPVVVSPPRLYQPLKSSRWLARRPEQRQGDDARCAVHADWTGRYQLLHHRCEPFSQPNRPIRVDTAGPPFRRAPCSFTTSRARSRPATGPRWIDSLTATVPVAVQCASRLCCGVGSEDEAVLHGPAFGLLVPIDGRCNGGEGEQRTRGRNHPFRCSLPRRRGGITSPPDRERPFWITVRQLLTRSRVGKFYELIEPSTPTSL